MRSASTVVLSDGLSQMIKLTVAGR